MSLTIKTAGRAILCEFPSGEKLLIGEIEIDCPGCGQGTWKIAGHHMRSVLRLLAEWVEEFPELTGPEEIDTTRERWSGSTGGDPTTN
ncbi:MAG: hypothetical protein ACREVZ_16205 [Burkholderiales bacterium]